MYESVTAAFGSELGDSAAATLQHLALIKQREEKLKASREDAEDQLLHRIGSAFRAGEIGMPELITIQEALSDLRSPGRALRWNAHIDIPWNRAAHLRRQATRYSTNGPEGTWIGEWPLPEDAPRPSTGTAVVYVLYDPNNEPCYVGSTSHFWARMNAHDKAGKRFARWRAHPCRDREHAYLLEERLLREHKPYLNRKAGR